MCITTFGFYLGTRKDKRHIQRGDKIVHIMGDIHDLLDNGG